jgi:hypothetical protein
MDGFGFVAFEGCCGGRQKARSHDVVQTEADGDGLMMMKLG